MAGGVEVANAASNGVNIVHIDMDAFFASVEVHDDPALAGKPVIVGGASDRGVVASASYESRAYGVRSAMPTVIAKRLCPSAVIVAPRHDRYAQVNRTLLAIIESVTPDYEPVALDEAYLDLSGAHRLFGDSEQIARALRSRVRDELGLGCSLGVGRTKLIAKLASRAAKPSARLDGTPPRPKVRPGRGVVVVASDEEIDFLAEHPIRAIPGVGPKTEQRLADRGITTVQDARVVGRERLGAILGEHQGRSLADAVMGVDRRRVEVNREARSIGRETTFDRDLFATDELVQRLAELAASVQRRADRLHLVGRTVTVKVRFSDYDTISRSTTPRTPPANAPSVAELATALLTRVDLSRGVRLLGVHLSNLIEADLATASQLELFTAVDTEQRVRPVELDAATEAIRRRFGEHAVGKSPLRDGSRQQIDRSK